MYRLFYILSLIVFLYGCSRNKIHRTVEIYFTAPLFHESGAVIDLEREFSIYSFEDALVYELTITNSSSYTKTIWDKKNNVKYIITMSVFGETQQARDSLVNQYKQDFENILNSVKLKYVDPAEVEKLGNHPD